MNILVDIKINLKDFKLNIDLDEAGSIGLLGASGCGKSMTLKSIAGIITPDEGVIKLGDKVLFDSSTGINLPPQERNLGFVFQNYALFPHMTVYDNIGFALKKSMKKSVLNEKIVDIGKSMEIDSLFSRYPNQLSGGQQQRVALARALITEPKMLLLDEPFSALDSYLKLNLQNWLEKLIKDFDGPVIFVSHNINEVSRICNKVIILDKGQVVESGLSKDVLLNPKSLEAAVLSGCRNISKLDSSKGNFYSPSWNLSFNIGSSIEDSNYIGFHSSNLKIIGEDKLENTFKCRIVNIWNEVNIMGLDLMVDGGSEPIYLEMDIKDFPDLNLGDEIFVGINSEDILVLK